MGLFSASPALDFPDREVPLDARHAAEVLPDPGQMLLALYAGADRAVIDRVAAEVARVRQPTGGYVLPSGKLDKRSGPLWLLKWIMTGDWIAIEVWASQGLSGAQKREMRDGVVAVHRQHGAPAAATWAVVAWGSDRRAPSLDILAGMLASGYGDWRGKVTNGMYRDSITKWRPVT